MPDVTGAAREQLLLHQFVAGLPASVSKQLRAAGDVTRIETAVERARLLMALEREHIENHPPMVAATSAPPEQHKQVQELKQQVEELTTQVATLVKQRAPPMTQQSRSITSLRRCFYCNQIGHFQSNCPKRRSEYNRRCYTCGQFGHVERNCWQGNYRGASGTPGRGRPFYQ